jgi:PAS domain S-box-containing protein
MAAMLLTSGAVLLLACAAFITYEVVTLRKSMVESYTTRAAIIAANSTAALAFQNEADATEVLGALKTDPRIVAACLYDDKGKLFAKYPADAAPEAFPPETGESGYRPGYLEIFRLVVQDGRTLGTVYLRSNLSALTERYHAYAWVVVGVVAGSILAAFLLSQVLEQQISDPVLALARTAQAVTDHQNFSIRAQKYGEDELGKLTDTFNQMLREIQAGEQALKSSEERFRAMIENSADGIAVSDSEGRALYTSPALTRMLGVTEQDLVGKNRKDLVHPEDTAYVLEKMAETLQNPGKIIQARYRLKHKDGSWRWVDMTAANLIDNPAVGGIVRNIRDVTEKLKMEEIARLGEAQAIENIKDYSIIMLDPKGKILTWNAGAEKIKGYKASEVIGKDFSIFYIPEDVKTGHPGKLLETAAKEGWAEKEGWRMRKDGSRFLANVVITALKNEKDELRGFIKVTRDITEQKRQQELQLYTRALEVSNKEMQDFVFVASHDLQEPLRKIQSFGEFLAEEYKGALEGNGQDYLQRMRSAAGRMQTLINDLLTLTRVTTKAKPFEPTDLSKVVQDVLSDLEVRIQEKKAKVEIGSLPTLAVDPTQMRQLFQNLIGNALKFQRPGVPPGIRVEATVTPGRTDGGTCRITVADNGIGFDNKYAEQIFKVFERLHGRDEYEGTGIGLAVCRKVVERHGGTIMAEGTPGQGSCFTIELPLQPKAV